MCLLRMARVEPCSEATKTLAILLTVKPSKLCNSKTLVFCLLYAKSLGFSESAFLMYLHGNCTFNLSLQLAFDTSTMDVTGKTG